MNIKLLILTLLLLVTPAMAGTGTISIWGTNVSTAQANVTISNAPNNVTVTAWNVNGIKTFTVAVTNASDTIVITVANNSANQIDEFLVNGTSINGLQVNETGWYNITYTQKTGNATFTLRPALQSGGFNWSWGWFQYLTVVNSTTINKVIITNTTTLNATNIAGGGAGISQLNTSNLTSQPWINKTDTINASNLTGSVSAINGSAIFGLNMSNQTTCRGNMTCTYNANGSVSLDATSNLTAIFNNILNTSTITAGVYPNGSVELTATATAVTHTFNDYSYTETDPNSVVTIANNNISVIGETNGASRVTKQINATGNFSVNFSYSIVALASSTHGIVWFSDINGRYDLAPFNGIGLQISDSSILYVSKSVNGVLSSGAGINLVNGIKYYGTLVRSGNVLTVGIFTDSARTTHTGGSPQSLAGVPTTPFTNFSAMNNGLDGTGSKTFYIADIQNIIIGDRVLNVQYMNGNTAIILTATANYTVPISGTALLSCLSNQTLLSGETGIKTSGATQQLQLQTVCIVPANTKYALNETTLSGGIVSLSTWREVTI